MVSQSAPTQRIGAFLSLSILLASPFANCQRAVAVEIGGPASNQSTTGTPVNLDLSSKAPTMTAGNLQRSTAVNINTGSAVQTVTGSTLLTPAQMVAATQVASTGSQSILLGAGGNAVGGTLAVGAQYGNLGNVVIPQGVTAINNVASSMLNMTGNLNNFGTLLAISNNPAVTTATISAANIFNNPGAVITTVIPQGGVAGYSNLVSNLNLSLNSLGVIVNSGTISSAGNLSAIAGGTISNILPATTSAEISAPQITALGNISLVSGAGQFVNSGLIQAMGSLTFATPSGDLTTDLVINNTNGVVKALGQAVPGIEHTALDAGLINVREHGYSGTGNTNLVGGDWRSNQVNLNGGQGQVEVNVNKMDGKINMEAGIAHVLADTPMLTLGDCTIDGDPTYVNVGGAIQISGTLTETAPLAIIAKTNVNTASNAAKIINRGNPVWIIAGASINTSNGSATGFSNTGSQTLPGGALTGGFIQVTAAGGSGGDIDFSASTIGGGVAIDTASTTVGSPGGDVNLIAVGNGATGRVLFPAGSVAVSTSGLGSGANGNVSIYAGATSGASSITNITNNGGTGAAGNVTIKAAAVTFGGGAGTGCGNCISFDQNGIATGSVTATSPTNSTVTMAGPVNSNGTLSIAAGGITVNASSALSAKSIDLTTNTGSNGAISVSSNMTGTNGISLTTDGTGAATLAAGIALASTNSNISITSRTATFNTATINAGTGTVILKPNNNSAISFNGGATGFIIPAAAIANITAGTLQVGDSGSGTLTQASVALDVSSKFNLDLRSGVNFTTTTSTTTLGTKTLNITVAGSATTDTIVGGATTVDIDAGSIILTNNINLGTSGTIDLTANSSPGTITRTAGTLTAKTLNLTTTGTGASNIGSLTTAVSNLSLNTTSGNATVANTGLALSLNTSTVGGNITVTNNTGYTVDGNVAATGTVALTASAGNGGITLNANLSGTDVTLAANGSGTITRTAGTLTGSTSLTLTSTSGAIGPLTTATPDLTLNTTGLASITNTNTFTNELLLQSSGANFAGLSVSTTGNIRTKSTLSSTAGTLALTTTGTGFGGTGEIRFEFNATALNANLTSFGSGFIVQNTNLLTLTGSNSVSISSTSGDIGALGVTFSTITPSLSLNTTGAAFIDNQGVLSVSAGASKFEEFRVTNNNSLTLNTAVTADSVVYLDITANNGSLVTNGAITLDSGFITLGSFGTGTMTINQPVKILDPSGGTILVFTRGTLAFGASGSLDSGNGNYAGTVTIAPNAAAITIGINGGTGALLIPSTIFSKIQTNTLTIGASTAGAIDQAGTLTIDDGPNDNFTLALLTNSTYTGTSSTTNLTGFVSFQVDSLGAVNLGTITGLGSAVTVTGDSITLQKNVNVGSASLTTNALSGHITTAAGATLTASTAFLTTKGTTSNIGTSAASRLQTAVSNLQLSTTSGGAFINNTTGTLLTLAPSGISTVTGAITLDTNAALNLANSISGTAVTLTSSGDISQAAGTITGSTSITLTSTGSGNIGSLNTSTPTLKVDTAGSATIINTTGTGLNLTAPTKMTSLNVQSDRTITTGGAISTTGTITLTGTANNAAITVSGGNLDGESGVVLTTNGTGILTVNTSRIIKAIDKTITVTANNVTLTGDLDAGTTGTVILQPNAAGTTIGLNGGAGTFSIAATDLGNITAGTLQVGNSSSGTITEAGTVNVSGAGPAGVFNLDLRSGGNFSGPSTSGFTLGTKTLTMDIVGSVQLGTISGGNTSVTIDAGSVVLGTAVANNVTLGATSTVDITTTANSGNITQFAGTTITAQNVLLKTTGSTANIGAGSITTAASNLTLSTASGNATVTNSGAVSLNAGSVGGNLSLSNNNQISVSGAVTATGTLGLTTTAGSGAIALGANLSGTAVTLTTNGSGAITQSAGTLSGTSISLSSTSGNFGAPSLATSTASLTLNTTGSANIQNTTGGTLQLFSGGSTFSNITVATDHDLSTKTAIGGTVIALSTSANNGSISIGGDTNGNTTSLIAHGSGNITQTAGYISGNMTLSSTSGNIGPLDIFIGFATFNTTGNVTLNNTKNCGICSSGGGIFSQGASSAANITISSDWKFNTGTAFNATGSISLSTSSNVSDGGASALTVSHNLNAATTTSISVANGTAEVANGVTVFGPNGITVTTNSIKLNSTGALNAGSSTVALEPLAGSTIGLQSAGTFQITSSTLSKITAGTLRVGNSSSGNLTQDGTLNVSGTGAGAYNLDLQTGGNYAINVPTVTLGSKTFSVSAKGTASLPSITGGSTTVTASASSIALGNAITLATSGSSINLSSSGVAGSISGGGSLTAENISATTTGSGASNIAFNVGSAPLVNVTANTVSGNATIQPTGSININTSTVGGNFTVNGGVGAAITVSGAITATGTVGLSTFSSPITLNNDIGGTAITISTTLNNNISQTGGKTITGSTSVSLASGSGSISSISTATPALTVNTTGAVSVVNNKTTGMTLSSSGATFSSLSITNNGGITTNTSLNSAGTLSLISTANNGAVALNFDASGTVVAVTANGNGAITQAATKTLTGSSSIALTSTSGNIGGIATSTPSLALSTAGGAVTVTNTTTAGLSVTQSGGNFGSLSLSTDHGLTLGSALNSNGALSLSTSANSGNIALPFDVSGTVVSLSANGAGNITQTGGKTITGTTSLALSSGSGTITSLTTSTPILSASTSNAVALTNSGAITSLTSTASSSFQLSNNNAIAIGAANLTSSGAVTLTVTAANGGITASNGSVSAGGLITLSTNGTGALTVGAGKSISTSGSNNVNVTAASLSLAGGLSAGAGSGNVTLQPMDSASSIGVNGGIGSFQVSAASLAQISAATLTIGSNAGTGAIDVNTGASTLTANWNLVFLASTSSATASFVNNKTIAMGGKNLTLTVGGPVTLGNITGTANSLSASGSAISVNAAVNLSGASSATLSATGAAGAGAISGSGSLTAATLSLSSINDFIGQTSGSTPLSTAATTSLTANAGAGIDISNTGALASLSSTSSTSLILSNNNSIDVAASGISSSGLVTLSTTANNGSVNVNNGSVSAGGVLTVSAHGTGTVNVGASKSLSTSGNNNINISSAGVAFTGTVNAGTGSVALSPSDNTASIGINGASGTYTVSTGTLGQITASTVVVGSAAGTGAIVVNNSSTLSPSTNLTILGSTGSTASTFTNNGTIAMGGKTLTVTVGGAITAGSITGTANSVNLTGRSIDFGSNNLNLSGSSTATLHATGASGAGFISGTGTITAATLSMTADNDFIGATSGSTPLVTVSSTSLVANAGGAIDISNTGPLANFSSTSSAALILNNNNTINIAAAGVNSSGALTLSVTANNGSINANNGSINAAGLLSLSTNGTGTVNVGPGKSLSTTGSNSIIISSAGNSFAGTVTAGGGSGNVTLTPINNSSSIGINGGAGTYQVTGLGQITANTLTIGSVSGTGAIDVSVPLTPLNPSSNLIILASPAATTATFTNNDQIDMGGKNLTISVGGAVTTGLILGNADTLNITGRSITINRPISLTGASAATLHAIGSTGNGFIAATAGSVTAESISLVSDNDFVGTIGQSIGTITSTLTASAAGTINILNIDALSSFSSATSSSLSLISQNTVNIGASGVNSSGSITMMTTANNGSINVTNGSIVAGGDISISANSTGGVSVGAGKTIQTSGGNDIYLTARIVSLTGTLDAGASGDVSLRPNDPTLSIGVNGGAGSVQFTGINQVTASTLIIGSTSVGSGKIELSSAGNPISYNQNLRFTGDLASATNAFQANDGITLTGGKTLTLDVGGNISANGTLTASTMILSSGSGSVGSNSTPLSTVTSASLTTSSSQETNISHTGVINVAATSSKSFKLINNDTINLFPGGINSSGDVTLTTTANNGSINVTSDNISSGGLVQLSTQGSGTINVGGGRSISTTGTNQIILTSSAISLTGTVNAGSGNGQVTLRPTDATSTIGVAGAVGTFQVSTALLNQITAKNVTIGQASGSGNIEVGVGSFTVNTGLTFLSNTGNFNNNFTINMGSNPLTVTATNGTISSGNINGNATTVTLTGKSIIAGNITLTGVSTATLHATGSTGSGSITGPGATVKATTISLVSDNDFIGSDDGTTQFQTGATTSLSASASGGICILNTGVLASLTSAKSARIDFFNDNNFDIGAAGINSSGFVNLATYGNNGSINIINGSVTTGTAQVVMSTDGTGTVTVGAGKSVSGSSIGISSNGATFIGTLVAGGGTGMVTLFPIDNSASIGINGGAGTVQFKGIEQISAGSINIGNSNVTGAIELGTAGTPLSLGTSLFITAKTSVGTTTFKNNDTINVNAGSTLGISVGGVVTTGTITGTGASIGVSLSGKSINLNGNIAISGVSGLVTMNASGTGGISGSGTVSAVGVNLTAIDDIGGGTPLSTGATTMSLNAAKGVNISNTGALTVGTTGSTPTSIQITNNNTITTTAGLKSSGSIVLSTTANGGSINLSGGSINSTGGPITLTTNGLGTVSAGVGTTVTSATSDVTITSANNILTGTLQAAGTVTLKPNNNGSIIGVNGGAGSFQVTAADLGQITANTLIIGSNAGTAAINVNTGVSTLTANWNLTFLGSTAVTTSSFTNNGTIAMGGKTLTITVGGAVNLGNITGTSSTVSVTGSSISTSGSLSGANSATLHATGAAGSGAISGSGTFQATTLSLTSDNDFIGATSSTALATTSANLTTKSAGATIINNTGALANLTSTASSSFTLTNNNAIAIGAGGINSTGAVQLSSGATGINISNGSISAGSTISLTATGAGTVTVGAGKSVSTTGNINVSSADNTFTGTVVAGASGIVTLTPSDNTASIGVNGGTGTYLVTAADLASISTASIVIGSASGTGAIDVNSVAGALTATANMTFRGSSAVTTSTFTNNGTLAMGGKSLTIDVGGAVTTGIVTGTANAVSITGDSINVDQNLTLSGASSASLHAIGSSGAIFGTGTLSAATLTLDSDNASIAQTAGGTGFLNTKTSALTATAGGPVNISNTGSALTITNSNAVGSNFNILNDNNISLSTGGITAKNVSIAPNIASLTIGVNGGAGAMQITGLGNVSASSLTIGSAAGTGAINVNSAGTPLNANWDLAFIGSSASFTNNDTIAMGTHTLNINTGGAVTLGNITGTANAIVVIGSSINVNGSVNLSGASTANLQSTGSAGSGAISGTGTLAAATLSLLADNDFIGKSSGTTPLSTKASILTVNAGGAIDISNSGALTGLSSTSSTQLILSNDNSISTNSVSSTGAITLSNTSGGISITGSGVTGNGAVTITASAGTLSTTAALTASGNNNITLTASDLSLGAAVNAGSGTVTLKPSTSTTTIGINGGAGAFQVSSAELGQITADTIVIGSSSGTGAINVNTAGTPLNASTNLTFLGSSLASGSTFTNNDTINMGSKNLTVNVGGTINLGTVNSTGTVSFNSANNVSLSSTGTLNLGASTANALTLNSTGTINATANLTAGVITATATQFNIPAGVTVSGTAFTLTGNSGSALTLGNEGTLISTVGNISITSPLDQNLVVGVSGQTGTLSANGTITFTAPASDGTKTNSIDVVGSLNLNGNSFMTASGASQKVTIEPGVTVNASTNLVINTPFLDNQGTINGKLVISAQGIGTIANTNPAINLDLKSLNGGSFTFLGSILTIVSAGGIVNTATTSTIDLQGTTQTVPFKADVSGGTLNLIAGFNFTGGSGPQPALPPDQGTYTLTGTTNAGKNIDLSKTTINTSFGSYAGNVLAVATGSIKMGPINTSASATGIAGNVTLIGNGVTTSTINSSGLNSGTVSITSGTAAVAAGPAVVISKGVITSGSFTTSALGGNIKVGAITGGNGNITVTTGGTGTITNGTGAITTTGLLSVSNAKGFTLKTAASNLQLNTPQNSFTANVTVTSSVDAVLQSSTIGGNLTVNSAFGLQVADNANLVSGVKMVLNNTSKTAVLKVGSGAILTAGVLTGAPGSPAAIPTTPVTVTKAGSITISSSTNTTLTALSIGDNAQITSNGGGITIKTTFAGADLDLGDSPALGPNLLQANGGTIAISSLGDTEVGSGGTGAHILARALGTGVGAVTISGKNALSIGHDSVIQANKAITLTASAATSTFTVGNNVSVNSGFGANLAGALSLTSGGTTPTIMNIGTNANFSSNSAALTISAKSTLNIGDGSTIQATGGAATVKSTGAVNLASIGATNGVSIKATKVGTAGGAVTVSAAGTGLTVGGPSKLNAAAVLKITTTGTTGNMTIDDGAQLTGTGASAITSAGTGVLNIGESLTINNAGAFTISAPAGSINIGTLGGGSTNITTTTSTGTIKISTPGNIQIGSGNLAPSTTLTISSTKGQVQIQGTNIVNADAATITAPAGVSITDGSQISTDKNFTVTVSAATGNLTVNDAKITAGTWLGAPPPANQPFDPALVGTKGAIVLSAGNAVNIGNNNDWSSIGGNITVTAKASNMQIGTNAAGTNNSFVANGGNIVMLAKGTVTGANGNFFHAIGMGTSSSNNVGGGIEVGSGLTSSSALTAALNLKGAPINPAAGALGTGVVYTGNINGVIQANNKSGNTSAINLNAGANGPSQLFLNGTLPSGARGGAQVFDAATAGSSINFDNATFQTEAFKPIAMSDSITIEENTSLPVQLRQIDSETTAVAVGNNNAELSLFSKDEVSTLIPAAYGRSAGGSPAHNSSRATKQTSQIFARPNSQLLHRKDGTIKLLRGEIFMSTADSIKIRIASAEIQAEKGALMSVSSNQGCSYIRDCSGAGTVTVHINGKTIVLNAGEELLLTNHKPDQSELNPEDGVGRRHSRTMTIGNTYATISDFAIITLISSSAPVSDLRSSNKQIINRMLKTAATIDMVLKHRGPYTAH